MLRRTGRPLRAAELFEEISRVDRELGQRANPSNFLLAVLSDGIKAGRLVLHKVKGTRGGYYLLEEWVDEHGEPDSAMIMEML